MKLLNKMPKVGMNLCGSIYDMKSNKGMIDMFRYYHMKKSRIFEGMYVS